MSHPPAISRRRLWFFRLAALLLPFVFLVVLEAALRVGGYGFDPHYFKKQLIGTEEYYVQNEDFSRLFFPVETARYPGVLRMHAVKPRGTIRIFVFGESAAMGDPEPSYGPARFMEMQLREKFPGTKFEVVNVAFTAIDSHVIVPIARECAGHEGDYWIVYMGNNEMVGPFGAATVFGRQAPPLPYVRLVTAIKRTRTGQLFAAFARKIRGEKASAASWAGMQMFLNNQIAPDSPLKKTVYRNFEKNLDDILRVGTRSGAKIVLNTVAVNLKDCPPFASQPSANGTSADAAYSEGQQLLAQGDFAGAQKQLQLACDEDALPFRTDSRENAIICETGKKYAGAGVTLFDAAGALAGQNPDKLCGSETFYEHVHFDFDGSHRLGLAWAQQLEALLPATLARSPGWLSPSECEARLGLSDWNRALVWEHMAGRLQVPPFSNQSNNGHRLDRLMARLKDLHANMNPGRAALAETNFIAQLAGNPDDFELRENHAAFLESTGDLPGAMAECQHIHELIPHDFLPYFQLGRLQNKFGKSQEAEAALRAALQVRPSLTDGWTELATALTAQGRYSEAVKALSTALAQRPQDAQIIFRTGKVYALQGNHAKAVELYQQSIKLNPANWEAHYELGAELDAAGQLEGAVAEFGEAARLRPDYSRAHFNHGVLLAKTGRLDDAQQEFETTLRLEPGYKNAQDSLAKIQQLKLQRSQ